MCAAREPRRFNGLCDTCCWFGHLSCDCLLQRDRIYSDVPTLSSRPISSPSYSGRSGGPGSDIPCYPPQQPAPRPFSSFVRYQRYNGGHRTAPQKQPAPRPFSSFVRDQRYNGGHRTAPQQQPGPRPFCSFGWEQRGACRDGPPVNGLVNSIAQGQAQRDVEMDCHGGPVSKVSGPPEIAASIAIGEPPLQACHLRRLQPPSGTLSAPTVVISNSASEQWLQSDNMKMPMFSQSEIPQQSAPTAVTLAATALAGEAVTGTRVFTAVSSKGVVEAPASSAWRRWRRYLQQRRRPVVLFSLLRRWGGRRGRPLLQME